jgi:hypothetical protein
MANESAQSTLNPLAQARAGAQINTRMNRLTVRFEHFVHLDTMLVHEAFANSIRAIIERELDAVRDALTESGMTFPAIAQAGSIADLEHLPRPPRRRKRHGLSRESARAVFPDRRQQPAGILVGPQPKPGLVHESMPLCSTRHAKGPLSITTRPGRAQHRLLAQSSGTQPDAGVVLIA